MLGQLCPVWVPRRPTEAPSAIPGVSGRTSPLPPCSEAWQSRLIESGPPAKTLSSSIFVGLMRGAHGFPCNQQADHFYLGCTLVSCLHEIALYLFPCY